MVVFSRHGTARDRESVRIGDKEIPVHIITSGNAGGRVPAGLERMTGVAGDASGIHESHRIQHRAAVFIEQHSVSYGVANDLQSNALRLKRGRMWTVVIALDGRVVHEVELDIANAP